MPDNVRNDNRTAFTGGATLMGGDADAPPEDPEPYVAFVKELLEAEEKRNAALETRSIAVVTTSGALVTLLLALGAWITRVQTAVIEQTALTLAFVSALLFVLAALLAIGGNAPWKVWAITPTSLSTELWARWLTPGDRPDEKVTATRLKQWESARKLSSKKANLLAGAVTAQALAVLVLTVALGIVLL